MAWSTVFAAEPVEVVPAAVITQSVDATATPSTTDATTVAPVKIPPVIMETLKQLIKEDINKITVAPAAITGLYEVVIGSEIIYISADGRYLIVNGDMIETQTRENLTDNKRGEFRKKTLDTLNENEMVVFAPKEGETKYTINVFTDVDCGYCKKFHSGIDKLTAGGVKVRYLAFPRAGAGSKTYDKMVSVWCSEDRQKAMTDAKADLSVPELKCDNSVQKEYELGQSIGVNGTPALLLSDGKLIPGYVPPEQLIALLRQRFSSSPAPAKIPKP
ncbi:MAG: hypothetical protein BWK79_15665 [Beggiatoa sp. IS2]|nr:MAG: hypothetical protein BWK79_15665 [Beggiatoa sp. IS2]